MAATDHNTALQQEPLATFDSGAKSRHLRVVPYLLRASPYLIALFFALWGLRGAFSTDVVDTDAARHAMNGAFLYDLVREGHIHDPISYAKYYYGHFPALSLPYHPPFFPLIEAVLFAIFGVSVLTARVAISAATFITAVLLYKLVARTHGYKIALIAVPAFLALPVSQAVANEIMLEMPALVFVVAAIYVISGITTRYRLTTGLLFALLAAAGVWTKQTVFLCLVPFAIIAIRRQWKLLAGWTIWVSSTIIGAATAGLLCLSLAIHWTGVNRTWPHRTMSQTVTSNARFYLDSTRQQIGLGALLLAGGLIVVVLFATARYRDRFRSEQLYAAWILSVVAVLLFIRAYDERYLLFLYPAVAVLACSALFRISQWLFPRISPMLIPAALALIWSCFYPYARTGYLHGPSRVAQLIVGAHASRVLYCGRSDGNFIFQLRSLDKSLHTVVFRGDKVPSTIFSADQFEHFAQQYGIEYVVFERNSEKRAWDNLRNKPVPSLVLERQIPLSSNRTRLNGDLRVYRFLDPATHPLNHLAMPISVTGRNVEFDLGRHP